MRISELTPEDALKYIDLIESKLKSKKDLTIAEKYLMQQIELYFEENFIAKIRDRQKKLSRLKTKGRGRIAYWGGELTPGCNHCISKNGVNAIRSVSECNLNCKFCYYHSVDRYKLDSKHFYLGERLVTAEDIKIVFEKQEKKPDAVSWVYYEPFMDFEKHLDLIEFFSEQGVYQHLYTNGTLCNSEHFKILGELGLNEIRFDLAATNCSPKVIEKITEAKKYIKYVCIESPMYQEYFDQFVKRKESIINSGVDQINCAELHLNKNHQSFQKDKLYRYKYGYISPVTSRDLTYRLIEMAEEENWQGITILDCSNETKFYRGIATDDFFGKISFRSEWDLPVDWYRDVIKNNKYINSLFRSEISEPEKSFPELSQNYFELNNFILKRKDVLTGREVCEKFILTNKEEKEIGIESELFSPGCTEQKEEALEKLWKDLIISLWLNNLKESKVLPDHIYKTFLNEKLEIGSKEIRISELVKNSSEVFFSFGKDKKRAERYAYIKLFAMLKFIEPNNCCADFHVQSKSVKIENQNIVLSAFGYSAEKSEDLFVEKEKVIKLNPKGVTSEVVCYINEKCVKIITDKEFDNFRTQVEDILRRNNLQLLSKNFQSDNLNFVVLYVPGLSKVFNLGSQNILKLKNDFYDIDSKEFSSEKISQILSKYSIEFLCKTTLTDIFGKTKREEYSEYTMFDFYILSLIYCEKYDTICNSVKTGIGNVVEEQVVYYRCMADIFNKQEKTEIEEIYDQDVIETVESILDEKQSPAEIIKSVRQENILSDESLIADLVDLQKIIRRLN